MSSIGQLSDEERGVLAEQWGFNHIGRELPDDVRLSDIIKTLPREVFEINEMRGWLTCLTSIVAMAASLFLIHISPVWALPFAWALAGTAFTGWFVIGHDCGHKSFSKNKVVEDIVGLFFFAPLLYPFEPWRIKHNQHHTFTNKLVDDTAWHPVMKSEVEDMDKAGALGAATKTFLGSPLKLWASTFHWAMWHFDINKFTEKQRPKVYLSWAACALFAATAFPFLVTNFGWMGLVKYWLMPWLGYHFWMSTFTIIHHTAPHIPFKAGKEWNAAKAQLSGTVHCDFPKWVEFLCHDISVHVPHHVASNIPWYNLRKAYASLQENWGEYMTDTRFNPRMLKAIITQCHVYDEEKNYVPFDYRKEEPFLAFQRKVLPNTF